MGQSTYPAISSKTMYRTTLTSGTSWTVPSGVTYVNVSLLGGGGGSSGSSNQGGSSTQVPGSAGFSGAYISSTLSVTAGASITYAIGAGGGLGTGNVSGGTGGTTTFTGATSAPGGAGGMFGAGNQTVPTGAMGSNGATGSIANFQNGNNGGAGKIDIEYWL